MLLWVYEVCPRVKCAEELEFKLFCKRFYVGFSVTHQAQFWQWRNIKPQAVKSKGFLQLTSTSLLRQLEWSWFDVLMKNGCFGKKKFWSWHHSLTVCLFFWLLLFAWLPLTNYLLDCTPFSLPLCPSDQCCSRRDRREVWKAHAENTTLENASQRMTENEKCVFSCVCSFVCCLCDVCLYECVCVCVSHSIPFPPPFSVSDSPHSNGRDPGSVLMHGRNIKILLL